MDVKKYFSPRWMLLRYTAERDVQTLVWHDLCKRCMNTWYKIPAATYCGTLGGLINEHMQSVINISLSGYFKRGPLGSINSVVYKYTLAVILIDILWVSHFRAYIIQFICCHAYLPYAGYHGIISIWMM